MHVQNTWTVLNDEPQSMFSGQDQIPSRFLWVVTLNPSVVSLTIDDFFPDKESQKLQQRATHFLMGFLVDTIADLAHLQKFVSEIEPIHPAQKSQVVPMEVLFKDK